MASVENITINELSEGVRRMNKQLKMTAFVIFVENMDISKKFYQEIFGEVVEVDFGLNIGFKSGLSLWQKNYAQNLIFNRRYNNSQKNDMEIYYESSNLEEIWGRVCDYNVKIIHEIKEQPWKQRVFRVCDPDSFIIEVGETMESVVIRLYKSGLAIDVISTETYMPKDFVKKAIDDNS